MDLLTASLVLPGDAGPPGTFAVAIIPAATPGVTRRPFWGSCVLAGAESDEVVLRDVLVPEEQLARVADADASALLEEGFLWFELLISATYLGIASALVERALAAGKGTPADRALMASEVEGAMAALEGVARAHVAGDGGPDLLARALFVRFAVQQAIERAAALAAEVMGGMAFVTSSELACLFAAARALAFHPPSRLSISPALDAYLADGTLRMEASKG
jgi:alkylation response protein AidB-like acyl-CoA dehydrogenase